MATVEIYRDKSDKQEWRWRVKASNGLIIGASTEGYGRENHATGNLQNLPTYCREIDVKTASEQSDPRPEGATLPLEFYQDKSDKQEWRWRITAGNGQIVHASSEGYANKGDAKSNLLGLVSAVNEWRY